VSAEDIAFVSDNGAPKQTRLGRSHIAPVDRRAVVPLHRDRDDPLNTGLEFLRPEDGKRVGLKEPGKPEDERKESGRAD